MKIILSDTNAVIQLAIISTKVFSKNDAYELVVIDEVLSEIKGLLKNEDKAKRLGDNLKWLIANVASSKAYKLPSDWEDIDEVYKCQESAMFPYEKSSPTGTNDRKFLILADTFDVGLLTREKTLFNLSRNIIGIERTYGISDILVVCQDEKVLTKKEIQAGLTSLTSKQETIPERCKKALRDYGYKI